MYREYTLWALVAVIFYKVVSYIFKSITASNFKRLHGCEEPIRIVQSERIIGWGLFKTIVGNSRERRLLEATVASTPSTLTSSGVVMGQRMFSTTDPENVKTILATKFKDYGVGRRKDAFGPLLGTGIFTADGVHWEQSRALVRPAFTRSQISNLSAFEPHILALISRIPTDGSTVDLQPLFFNLLLDSATDMLFGASVNAQLSHQTTDKNSFLEAFDYAQAHIVHRANLGRFSIFARDAKFTSSCATVHAFVDKFVYRALEEKRLRLERASEKPFDSDHEDGYDDDERYVLLKELARSTDDPKQLRHELLNILLAARDTTAGLLSNSFHVLARHPEVWGKLKAEVDGLGGRLPDFETLKGMEYLKCFLNEALRLYPSVPTNGRYANKNTILPRGGNPTTGTSPIFIAAGDLVFYSVYAMHRSKAIFGPDADSFRPERWLTPGSSIEGAPEVPLRPGWGYLPFNGGPRVCIGQQNALTEAGYTVVRLVQWATGEGMGEGKRLVARGGTTWVEGLGLTLSSGEGTKVAFVE